MIVNGISVGTMVLNHSISPDDAPFNTAFELNRKIIIIVPVRIKEISFFMYILSS